MPAFSSGPARRARAVAALAVLAGFAAAPAAGAQQTAPPPSQAPTAAATPTATNTAGPALSLEEAVGTALRNNPQYQVSENGRRRAQAELLGANGAFFPTFNLSLGNGYREGRPQFFGGQLFGNRSGTLSSNWQADGSLNLSFGINASRRAARAGVDAAGADIGSAGATLRANVTQQYINALQQDARVRLQDTLLVTARAQLELARARAQVGVGTVLDVRRAEVTVGQTEVARLQAQNQAEVERLRLYQQLGVEPRVDARLTTSFALNDVSVSLADLLQQARQNSPALTAFRARERAAQLNVRAAQAQYLPTLSLTGNVGGFTQQLTNLDQSIANARQNAQFSIDQCNTQAQILQRLSLPAGPSCSGLPTPDVSAAQVRSANRTWPLNFTRNPYNIGAFISLPVFNGFQRERQIQIAAADEREAEFRRRSQELQLSADVSAAYRTLATDRRAAELQQRNAQVAREALVLAEERYKVGASALIDVLQARGDFERAQNDYITAVYQYQRDFATLENAIGRPLR